MSERKKVVVIGAGIVGVSTAIWLVRAGQKVTLLDRDEPGQATSYGNAGVLASCAVVPVSTPGLLRRAPGYLLNPDFPLFLRWSYLPRLAPWLLRFLLRANDPDTRRIVRSLETLIGDSVEQHKALVRGTVAESWVTQSDYAFAYRDRAAFDADAYEWGLKRDAGFVPELVEGSAVREYEPALGPDIGLLAVVKGHGYIRAPGRYVQALADVLRAEGGEIRRAEVRDVVMAEGRVRAVHTDAGEVPCDAVALCAGVWSGPLARKLGLKVPMESERGYHIVFKSPSVMPRGPVMINSGKFVATPMEEGLRCAGIVEFGGLEAGRSRAPFELLRRQVRRAFPTLEWEAEEEWMGHRPTLPDSLPMIGEIGRTGAFAGFGHQHIGLTGGPKTGRLLAGMIAGDSPNMDLSGFDPGRFR